MGRNYTVEELSEQFEAQFRDAPWGWKNFVAAALFASGVGYNKQGHLCFPGGENGETPIYRVRWFSRKLRDKLLKSWKIFHDAVPEDWRLCDRLWECAGYQATGAGIGLDDFAYEMRVSEEDIDAIEAAFASAGMKWSLEGLSSYRGVID